MNLTLDLDESIEFEILKNQKLPVRIEDWIKIPFFIFFSFLLYYITKEISINNFSKVFQVYSFFFSFLYVFIIFTIIKNYYKRYLTAFKWRYILTNKRLLIIDHKNSLQHSFYFDCFPQIELVENLLGHDYIIIGKKESLFEGSGSLISYRGGINFSEDDILLYNIENIKSIYNLLKSKIVNKKLNY